MKDNTPFEEVYREQLPRIYNFFVYRFGDAALAEDLTSTTFEKAWKNRRRFRRELSAFSTWLFTIAHRVAIDHYRRPTVERVLAGSTPLVDDETPEVILQRNNDLKALNDLLGRLPGRERELVAMKYGAGLTNRSIAQLTGLSESNVGVILHRTVQVLKKEWEAYND